MKKFISLPLVLFVVFTVSCSKKSDDSPQPTPTTNQTPTNSNPPNVNISSKWQFYVKIDGKPYAQVENYTTAQGGVSASKNNRPLPYYSDANYTSYMHNPSNSDTYMEFERGQLTFQGGSVAPTSYFYPFFPTGSYSYTNLGVDYITVKWYDSAGTIWSTDQGSADQTGSSFNVTERKEVFMMGGNSVYVVAKFNCKIYNSSGLSKTITDGVYVGPFTSM